MRAERRGIAQQSQRSSDFIPQKSIHTRQDYCHRVIGAAAGRGLASCDCGAFAMLRHKAVI
jgi:hypothetical protein